MSSETRYPRVLIIAANPISNVQAVGLMMGSLFRGWPRERLAQIYFPRFATSLRFSKFVPSTCGATSKHTKTARAFGASSPARSNDSDFAAHNSRIPLPATGVVVELRKCARAATHRMGQRRSRV